MPLNAEQVARMLSAGSVPIPSFPDPGQVSADLNAYTLPGETQPEITLQVVHYPSPANKNTYVVPLSEVTALYLPDGLTPGAGPTWFVGQLLRSGQVNFDSLVGGGRPGSVFVNEEAGVLITTQSAKTAGEIASFPQNCL